MMAEDGRSPLERAIEDADPWTGPPSSRRDDLARPAFDLSWKPEGRARFVRALLKVAILLLSGALLLVGGLRLVHAEPRPPQTVPVRQLDVIDGDHAELQPQQTVPVRHLWVIDGDTLDVLVPTKDRIRIEGIDAPESYRPHCEAEKTKGLEAKREAIRLIRAGREATVVRHGLDRYGRTLGTVAIDGKDLGETLMAQGLALSYRRGPDAKAERITHWCGPGEW